MFKEDAKYQIIGKSVNYHKNAGGYLAKPLKNGDYPGVIMIHEWWGLNDNIKEMADNLAGQGYVVLAVDLYNGEVADDANRARELSANIRQNPQEAIENMKSAISYLKENYQTENIASLGWCFGGQQSWKSCDRQKSIVKNKSPRLGNIWLRGYVNSRLNSRRVREVVERIGNRK